MSVHNPMNRRSYLKALAAALPAAGMVKAAPAAAAPPIQLHCDLFVDPAKEKTMLDVYHKTFRPAISKQPGFVSVQLLKLRSENQGKAPKGSKYRLNISFQTEEQRLKWVSTDIHQKAWGAMEANMVGEKFTALLYDPIA